MSWRILAFTTAALESGCIGRPAADGEVIRCSVLAGYDRSLRITGGGSPLGLCVRWVAVGRGRRSAVREALPQALPGLGLWTYNVVCFRASW